MKKQYIRPIAEVWTVSNELSIFAEMSFHSFGIDDYDQAAGDGYYEEIIGE